VDTTEGFDEEDDNGVGVGDEDDDWDGIIISVSDLFCAMVVEVIMSIAYDGFTRPGLGG
jgi:hypothetical protein